MQIIEYENRLEKKILLAYMDSIKTNNFITSVLKIANNHIHKIVSDQGVDQGKEYEKNNVIKALIRSSKTIQESTEMQGTYEQITERLKKIITMKAIDSVNSHFKTKRKYKKLLKEVDIKIEYFVFFSLGIVASTFMTQHANLDNNQFIYNNVWVMAGQIIIEHNEYIANQLFKVIDIVFECNNELEKQAI